MTDRYIEVTGDDRDLLGLIQCIEKRFGVRTNLQSHEVVRYQDDSDAMAHAFNLGLRMYVLGFVDSKVDGTLQVRRDSVA